MAKPEYGEARRRMVERQLRRRGISDERVLDAMGRVPREAYVPEAVRAKAYDDSALPLSHEQTISQPWVVAAICQAMALSGDETVLEVGTGSGYSAAVLSLLSRAVVSVERIPELVELARAALAANGVASVEVICGDGSLGHPPGAPYDAIAVHATGPGAPPTLLAQLADGGRLVMPVATGASDLLTVFRREGDEVARRAIGPCRFVPLIGEEGFRPG
ncbi:MAG TPA: protein-L-isoaspartate(D-aspartate) O-methyltransferase [Solirubrobacterales bacterium]|jgi:protein-L-isoaspartate(D-aspartate) O-methyltransferase|nr:protein-L-isoaspartate(D-aspartate) O-methyltransferase [Solirubrobacterales bacterium]